MGNVYIYCIGGKPGVDRFEQNDIMSRWQGSSAGPSGTPEPSTASLLHNQGGIQEISTAQNTPSLDTKTTKDQLCYASVRCLN